MKEQELIPHLFRAESGRITATLCKTFGLEHMEIAEDIASETFLAALETWTYKGIPENPVAWLYLVAKNKTKNYIKRDKFFSDRIVPVIKNSFPGKEDVEIDLTEPNILDSQLQMLFAVCHPCIPTNAQVGLALRILCGFGIDEIAAAFLTSKETINKRLFRAKEKLRKEKIVIEFPGNAKIHERLEPVLTTLYLLFSEGYYSESKDTVLREDICQEAMRLNSLLMDNEQTNQPEVNALFALMCFHASRFAARKDEKGNIVLYEDQDEGVWDQELITKGAYYLKQSARGNKVSRFHLEASIAFWYTVKADTKHKWENILQLYNKLLQIAYSPIAALNRTYALSRVNGKREAIAAAEKLSLSGNQFYHSLLGELYSEIDNTKAKEHLQKSMLLAKSTAEKGILWKRLLLLQ